MSADSQETLDLPQPPQMQRKMRFETVQLIGMLLILLIPISALLGVFGASHEEIELSSSDLTLRIEYPTRSRYQVPEAIEIAIQNNSWRTFPVVTVRFEREFISAFSQASFTPQVTAISQNFYEVELHDLKPSETQGVSVDFRMNQYGQHQGTITVSAEGIESIQTTLATFIFP